MAKFKRLFIEILIFIAILYCPINTLAYGNSGGTIRPEYTKKEIDEGTLGNRITFNSISDGEIGHEFNFTGVRVYDGDHGKNNVWYDTITAKDGETYAVRMFVHNNAISDIDTWKTDNKGVSENTKVAFNIQQGSDTSLTIDGIITSSNADPKEYYDNVKFVSKDGRKFHLEYVYGSALIENNGIGSKNNQNKPEAYIGKSGYPLSDDIVKAKSGGVLIGYDALDGKVPGCYQFSSFVGIKVKVVYDPSTFTLNKTVRNVTAGDKEWFDNRDVNIGDELEYQIVYHNTSNQIHYNVMIRDGLPANLEYISGTTRLWNETYPDGATNTDDTLPTTGINIGNYAPDANAYVRFRVKVVDQSLNCGSTTLKNWAKGTANEMVLQDFANVTVKKEGGQLNFIQIIVIALTILLIICTILIVCLWYKWRKLKKEFQSKNSDLE